MWGECGIEAPKLAHELFQRHGGLRLLTAFVDWSKPVLEDGLSFTLPLDLAGSAEHLEPKHPFQRTVR